MTVRANWFVAPVISDEPDPFAAPLEEVGERVDLTDPAAALQLRIVELLRREGNLENAGVTCALKARPDTICHCCSLSMAHDAESPLGVLCRIGREQEQVLTEHAVLEHGVDH